jgi:hypothetical protein
MSLIYLSELKDYRIPSDKEMGVRYVANCLKHIYGDGLLVERGANYMYTLWLCEKYVFNLDGFPERVASTKFK